MLRASRIWSLVLSLTALSAATTAVIAYQAPKSELLDRFAKANVVLDRAANASGGAGAIRGLKSLSFTADGFVSNDVQGYTPAKIGNPERDGRFRSTNAFDFASGMYYQRILQELQGGFGLEFASLYKNKSLYFIRYTSSDYTVTPDAPAQDGAAGFVGTAARVSPLMILQRALKNARTASWQSETEIEGQKADVVEFAWDETLRMRLTIGQSDLHIRQAETISPDPVVGDASTIARFEGDQTVGGFWFPSRVQTIRRGARLLDLQVKDVAVNSTFPEHQFDVASNFQELPTEKIETVAIGDGIYEIKGLGAGQYRSQFIVMDDFVIGFEALLGLPVSTQILGEIRKVAPGKPVKYVVISHFHSDHAGGVGVYAEHGSKVVTTEDNREVLTAYANARSTLGGQAPLKAPLKLDFEFVPAQGMEITDRAGRKVKVLNFANVPHVAQVLALYDAKTKSIVNGDLYSNIVRFNKTFAIFVTWLKSSELDVEWVLGTHHPRISKADLVAKADGVTRPRN